MDLKLRHLAQSLALFCLFLGNALPGQTLPETFELTLDYNIQSHPLDISTLPGGDILVLQRVNAIQTQVNYLTRINAVGEVVWNKYFPAGVRVQHARPDAGNAIFAVGHRDSITGISGSARAFCMRINASDGTTDWMRELYPGVRIEHTMFSMANGDLILVGGVHYHQSYVSLLDAAGGIRWEKRWASTTSSSNDPMSLALDNMGNCFVSVPHLLDSETTISRLDSMGNLRWRNRYPGSTYQLGVWADKDLFAAGGGDADDGAFIQVLDYQGTLQKFWDVGTTRAYDFTTGPQGMLSVSAFQHWYGSYYFYDDHFIFDPVSGAVQKPIFNDGPGLTPQQFIFHPQGGMVISFSRKRRFKVTTQISRALDDFSTACRSFGQRNESAQLLTGTGVADSAQSMSLTSSRWATTPLQLTDERVETSWCTPSGPPAPPFFVDPGYARMSVGPNPTTTSATLELFAPGLENETMEVVLFDAAGRTVRRLEASPQEAVDLQMEAMRPGIYFLRVNAGATHLPIKRIVKQ